MPRDAAWGGDIGIRTDLIDVQFSGMPAPGAPAAGAITVHDGAALGAVLSGTLGGWVRIGGPWRIVADAAVGAPIHSVTASDTHQAATGVSGITLGLALGVGVDATQLKRPRATASPGADGIAPGRRRTPSPRRIRR